MQGSQNTVRLQTLRLGQMAVRRRKWQIKLLLTAEYSLETVVIY